MNKEIAEKWVEALDSGEYMQGRERLKDDDRFCCLGVLCELHRLKTGAGHWDANGNYCTDDGEMDGASLPTAVQKWAEVSASNPIVAGVGTTLAELNDENRWPFSAIAYLIEKEGENL